MKHIDPKEVFAERSRQVGDANRLAVFEWYAGRPGARIKECAAALGLSRQAVGMHVGALAAEWRRRDAREAKARGTGR